MYTVASARAREQSPLFFTFVWQFSRWQVLNYCKSVHLVCINDCFKFACADDLFWSCPALLTFPPCIALNWYNTNDRNVRWDACDRCRDSCKGPYLSVSGESSACKSETTTPQIKKWAFCQRRFSQGWLDNERSCPKMLGMLGGAARKRKAQ